MTKRSKRSMVKRLAPMLAFVLLWTMTVLEGINWRYFDDRVAVFLLIPVVCAFLLLVIKEILGHREKIAKMKKRF